MLTEIQAGLGGAKAALDILKGVQALQSETAKNQAVINVQRHVIEAQTGLSVSLKRIDELEAEIVRLEDWSAEKQRYELADTGQGSVAYKLKEGVEPPEPQHWICPQCYQDGKKSILKHESLPIGGADTLVCNRCGYDVVTHGVRHNQNPPTPRAGAWGRGKGPF
jgi:hypothetical protein